MLTLCMRELNIAQHSFYTRIHECGYYMRWSIVMVQESTAVENSLARVLAPEDVAAGQFVMVLNEQHQYPCGRCNDSNDPEYVVVEVVMRPDEASMPRLVVAVCLPFVIVESISGTKEMLDVRSKRLARVSDSFVYAAL
tara:strand:+ start:405 stop:821 length:417 start_codon:yes stop_codon:yes gene_type:complete